MEKLAKIKEKKGEEGDKKKKDQEERRPRKDKYVRSGAVFL